MIFIDKHDNSFWNKSIFSGCIFVTLLVTLCLMFIEYTTSNTWLKAYQLTGDILRQILIASCLIIYFVRLQVTVWLFQKRKWTWIETIIISVLMSFVLYTFASVGGNNKQVLGAVEMLGVFLYLAGSYINTHSEYYRHVWKAKVENKGRLYTEGLFSRAMHINYLGDILLFIGLAMTTHTHSLLVIPLIMAMNFVFFIIPSLDRYLDKKYPDEFRGYASKTKKLIPMVY
jgi:protein-S-isoprenylcysteine O-methyltransferase Ste14